MYEVMREVVKLPDHFLWDAEVGLSIFQFNDWEHKMQIRSLESAMASLEACLFQVNCQILRPETAKQANCHFLEDRQWPHLDRMDSTITVGIKSEVYSK